MAGATIIISHNGPTAYFTTGSNPVAYRTKYNVPTIAYNQRKNFTVLLLTLTAGQQWAPQGADLLDFADAKTASFSLLSWPAR